MGGFRKLPTNTSDIEMPRRGIANEIANDGERNFRDVVSSVSRQGWYDISNARELEQGMVGPIMGN